MKRILALFIAVILVFPCFSINAQENVEINDEFSDITELLKITGIFKADEEIADKEITRGDFAAYLVKLKGIGEHFGEYGGYSFADVDSSVANYHEIYAAKDMGLINGYSDGTFRPENSVSVIEAAVCMTRVLGYNVKAEGLGGYPTGYYTVINELRLMEGIKATYNENLSFNDFVQLVFNALHTNVMAATSFGDDPGYEVKSGVTLLKSSFGISYIDGIVSAIDITSLFGDNSVSPYHAVIGDETFCVGNYNIEPMLGYNVRAYYKMEDSKEMVKLAIKSSKKNKLVSIEIEDITSIKDGNVTVTNEAGKTKKYTYDKNASIIYNGINTSEEFTTQIYTRNGKLLNGRVKLLDNDNSGAADVVFIEAYDNMIIGKVNVETGLVYDYFDKTKSYNLNTSTDEPYVLLYDAEGMETEVSALEPGISLVVFDSKDDSHQKYARAYISEQVISGKVTEIGDEEGRNYAIINETKYYVSGYAMDYSGTIIPGRTVDVILNVYGEIVKYDYSRNPGDYVFTFLCKIAKRDGFESKAYLKIMDENKNFITLPLADKIKFDGKIYNTQNKGIEGYDGLSERLKTAAFLLAVGEAPSDGYVFQMAKYGINNDGEINYLDTILDEDGTQMTEENCRTDNEVFFGKTNKTANDDTYYSSAQKVLGQSVVANDGYKIYMYPAKGDEEELEYYDVRTNYFKGSNRYPGVVYFRDTNKNYGSSLFMLQYQPVSVSGDLSTFDSLIVLKVTDCLDSEGSLAKKWYLFDQGMKSEVIVKPDMVSGNSKEDERIKASDVKPGDIVYIVKDTVTGNVDGFLMMYSRERDYEFYTYASYNEIVRGDVLKIADDHVKLLISYKNNAGTVTQYNTIFNITAANNCITVFDTQKNQARIGSISDLTSMEEDPDAYSTNLIIRRYQPAIRVIREIYIYK